MLGDISIQFFKQHHHLNYLLTHVLLFPEGNIHTLIQCILKGR